MFDNTDDEATPAFAQEWQKIIADCGLEKHMAIVGHIKSEYGMGHGHANALVGLTLAGNVAAP
jgi:ribosomal protein S24E